MRSGSFVVDGTRQDLSAVSLEDGSLRRFDRELLLDESVPNVEWQTAEHHSDGKHPRGDMALRWYSVVVDCQDVRKQATWWAQALDWTIIYESDDECVIIPSWVDETVMRQTPWDRIGPGMVFVPVPESKTVKNRLHMDLAPHTSQDRDAEIERLEELGAKRVDVGQSRDVSWTVLADPEGNEFCVLSSREQ